MSSSETTTYSLDDIVRATAATVNMYGFTAGWKAREHGGRATADRVREELPHVAELELTAEQEQLATTMTDECFHLLGAADQADAGGKALGDFQKKVLGIVEAGEAEERYELAVLVGFLGNAERNARRREIEAAKAADPSDYFGSPGERLETTVVIDQVYRPGSASFTPYDVVTGRRTDTNDVWVWRTNSADWAKVGQTYKVRFTVKRHESGKYGKRTAVNRVMKV